MSLRLPHAGSRPHLEGHHESALSDVILGGQDGLVNVLGVILGVAAASTDPRIVLAAGLAATIAESISMGAVAYTSTMAQRDHYLSELERERREIRELPKEEADEVREVYRRWGLQGQALDDVVTQITANEETWLQVMMADELNLSPVDASSPLRSAFIVGLSAIIGSVIPLAPFFLVRAGTLAMVPGILISLIVSAVVLFTVGAYKARVTIGRPVRSGLQMAIIGIVSALAGYLVGLLFAAPPG